MDKMIQYRYNRIRYLVREVRKGHITNEEFYKEFNTISDELFFLQSCTEE